MKIFTSYFIIAFHLSLVACNDPAITESDSTDLKAEAMWYPGRNGNETCVLQKDILRFDIERLPGQEGGCSACASYRVCLTLKIDVEDSIVHTCVKDNDLCNPPDFLHYNNSKWKVSHVGLAEGKTNENPDSITQNGGRQCQIGSAGSVLDFQLSDGQCWVDEALYAPYKDEAEMTVTVPDERGVNKLVNIQCHSREHWNEILPEPIGSCCTCTKATMECVWRVRLPPCSEQPTLPSPECACPPVSDECRREEEIDEENGLTNHVTILDCTDPNGVAQRINDYGINKDGGSYGCAVSSIPNCNNIKCSQFVPREAFQDFNTCLLPGSLFPTPV